MSASARSSPDPIVLPSSPPSAHNVRRLRQLGSNGLSVSPAKSIINDAPNRRGQSSQRFRLAIGEQSIAQPSPRAKRRLARQERRQRAGLDAVTGRPITTATSESPRKRRRIDEPNRDFPDEANTNDDSHEGMVSLEEVQSPRYRSVDFDENIDPQLLRPEPQGYQRSPQRPISPSNDGSDGSVGYDNLDIGEPSAPPGAFPREMPGESTMANEEFTMISGQSLASIKANNSILATAEGFDQSQFEAAAATPRQPLYPDVNRLTPGAIAASKEVRKSITARTQDRHRDHDVMSWQRTGRSRQAQSPHSPVGYKSLKQRGDHESSLNSSTSKRRRLQSPVERSAAQSTARSVSRYQSQSPAQDLDFDDIWAEEASRSLQEDAQRSHERAQGSALIPPIFSDEPQPPRRSKIPSTWRKTSGINLSYSDSPQSMRRNTTAATPRQDDTRRPVAAADERGKRTITPPSTDEDEDIKAADQDDVEDDVEDAALDEAEDHEMEDAEDELVEAEEEAYSPQEHENHDAAQEESELTNPDAAATQLQGVRNARQLPPNATGREPARHNAANSDNEESGMFWQSNTPALLSRPPRRPKRPISVGRVDLSDILRMDATDVAAQSRADLRSRGTNGMRNAAGPSHQHSPRHTEGERSSSIAPNAISSPLARSLFKASKLGKTATAQQRVQLPKDNNLRGGHKNSTYGNEDSQSADEASMAGEQSDMTDDEDEPSQSYQEHLNKHSPAKVRIDFNDSSLNKSGLDLHNYQRRGPPLFDRDSNTMSRPAPQRERVVNHARAQPPVQARAEKRQPIAKPQAPGFFSRLTSLLSAVIRPTGPVYVSPMIDDPYRLGIRDEGDPCIPTRLCMQLRSRYGVLPNHHPWTMRHMRTLHRMLNSLIAAQPNCIVPTNLALPPFLSRLVGKTQLSATGFDFLFKYQHACAINAFIHIMVPVSLVQAMERGEVDWLGDETAESYRGFFLGRFGNELCFKRIRTPEGRISREWLVKCIGCILEVKEIWLEQQRSKNKMLI